jgi:phosphatidylethanolamine-binding protein (PEBP) family uncharacterized protein
MLPPIALLIYATLSVSSPDFGDNAMIPAQFTCEGASISPALHLGEFPAETKTLAIIVQDPDAPMQGGFTQLDLSAQTGKAALEEAMRGHILAQGEIVGLYEKKK